MSSLRNLLPIDSSVTNLSYKQLQVAIYKTNTEAVSNGGQCCCWVVPTGVTFATFEVWGGGGDGGGACCCMGHYYGPFTGNYSKKTLQVTPGTYFCVCAAGSGCCAQQCCGTCGFPSWANCSNGTTVACAAGGCGGCVLCWRSYQGCTGNCIPACNQGCYFWGDLGFQSINSVNHVSNYCWQIMKEWETGGSRYSNNTRMGLDHCSTSLTISGCFGIGQAQWPSGPGNSATACGGGCCWGSWGAGGLVLITYG